MFKIESEKEFLSYKKESLTFSGFFEKVADIESKLKNLDDFTLIAEENPIRFYTTLFALWKNNKKVVFPNRDFFEGKSFSFVKYIVKNGKVFENMDFTKSILVEDTILFSSGSTGEPKGIVNKKEAFFENAKSVLEKIQISEAVSITPLKPYLVSALNHFLVHLFSKSHLIFADVLDLKEIENLSYKYQNLSYVGSPMHITSMLPFIKNRTPEFFFSSGDLFYPQIISSISEKFPTTKIFNVYGLAELGGRLFINRISEKSISSIGQNIKGTEVNIIDNEVVVKSGFLFSGYIKGDKFYPRENEFFKTGDLVIKVDGELEFYGRNNDEIKVGGNKISLKYIEKKISPFLSKEITPILISKEHELLGNITILILFSEVDVDLNRLELISKLREDLESYEIPHIFYKTKKIFYTQTMKIDRKELLYHLEDMDILK
jgi:acyl-CoA synthetase (AMP-forming)/AMP-acid ligase II